VKKGRFLEKKHLGEVFFYIDNPNLKHQLLLRDRRYERRTSNSMKRIVNILLGIWCAFVSFISPLWLSMIFLNITGIIYKYDYSMDGGTAIIIGIALLILWLLLGLVPNVCLAKKLYFANKKYGLMYGICIVGLCVLCFGMCDWDIIGFWTT